MKIILCDDDLSCARKIAAMVTSYYRNKEILAECVVMSDPVALTKRMDLGSFDVALLDAQMEPYNGIEVGRILNKSYPDILIVFVSALLDFAPQGYTIKTFRYLLKKDLKETLYPCLDEIVEKLYPSNAFLTYKRYNETIRVPYRDIYYLESDLRKINIFGREPGVVTDSFYKKLSDIYESLQFEGFLQISNRDIVNMTYIKTMSSYKAILSNHVELNVNKKDYKTIKDRFIDWKGRL